MVAAAGPEGPRIACEARAFDEEVGGVAIPTLRVRIWIHNPSSSRLELRPLEFAVEDDDGRRFAPREALHDGRKTGVVLAAPPMRSAVDVIFRLPDTYDPGRPRFLTLQWGFRIDDREYRHETILERGPDRSFRDPFIALPPRAS